MVKSRGGVGRYSECDFQNWQKEKQEINLYAFTSLFSAFFTAEDDVCSPLYETIECRKGIRVSR